jgi:hypothetical protein
MVTTGAAGGSTDIGIAAGGKSSPDIEIFQPLQPAADGWLFPPKRVNLAPRRAISARRIRYVRHIDLHPISPELCQWTFSPIAAAACPSKNSIPAVFWPTLAARRMIAISTTS